MVLEQFDGLLDAGLTQQATQQAVLQPKAQRALGIAPVGNAGLRDKGQLQSRLHQLG